MIEMLHKLAAISVGSFFFFAFIGALTRLLFYRKFSQLSPAGMASYKRILRGQAVPGDEPYKRFFLGRKYTMFNDSGFNLICDVINLITLFIFLSALSFVALIIIHIVFTKLSKDGKGQALFEDDRGTPALVAVAHTSVNG
jgi:hypothetical protein